MLARALVLVIVAFAALGVGCSREPDDQTPEGALTLFLDALERSAAGDRAALEDAYRLLDGETQRRLTERARSTTALGAREFQPWEMLVEERAVLRFAPRRGGLRSRPGETEGTAIVTVTGSEGAQRTEVGMRLEEDGWRVVIAVPDIRAVPAGDGPSGDAAEP